MTIFSIIIIYFLKASIIIIGNDFLS